MTIAIRNGKRIAIFLSMVSNPGNEIRDDF